jgi:hypothetical protein
MTVLLALLLAFSLEAAGSIMPILGNKGNGHACPVNGAILTAEHNLRGADRGFTWSDQYGNEGELGIIPPEDPRDVVELYITKGDTPKYYPIGLRPKVGDKVHWFGYDQDPKKGYQPERREAKVTGIVGGHIFYDRSPFPGDSGACILNEHDQAVGLMNFSFHLAKGKLPGGIDITTYFPEVGE